MIVPFESTTVSTKIGDLDISLETGLMANQTDGTVLSNPVEPLYS
jgi:polyribonucleotide nucleotidyltransferase